ncbi:Hypothetical protein (Fragment) [Durusdinium trenchii]|uniref:Bromo domain-containing protein n=1 Tax=Durusdinium trenchii TaxID=1381693 RepID=A0ABP0I0L2_9DINO
MDDELLATWARLPAEERARLLCVQEPAPRIDLGMQMLWAAELQSRQFGVCGSSDPFDHAQLPLLATMQFDGFMHKGQKVFKSVKWPKEFHQDPMILANALRFSLQASHGKRRSPAMQSSRWHQLLLPAAQSWAAFEIQLAQLVEQLVLRAQEVGPEPLPRPVGPAGAPASPVEREVREPTETRLWSSWAAATAPTDEAVPHPGDPQEAVEEEAAAPAPGSRAAKRARQRERRKLGKALARGEDVDDLAAAAGVTVPAARRGPGRLVLSARCCRLNLCERARSPHLSPAQRSRRWMSLGLRPLSHTERRRKRCARSDRSDRSDRSG